FSVWVVPSPSISDATVPILVNLVALVVFLTVALLIGFTVGLKRLRPVRDWLRSDREPTAEGQKRVRRAPVNAALIAGALWALATVVFTAINITFSGALAVFVAITAALGG